MSQASRLMRHLKQQGGKASRAAGAPHCPRCDKTLDYQVGPAGESTPPGPFDLTMCCGACLQFGETTATVGELSPAAFAELHPDEQRALHENHAVWLAFQAAKGDA